MRKQTAQGTFVEQNIFFSALGEREGTEREGNGSLGNPPHKGKRIKISKANRKHCTSHVPVPQRKKGGKRGLFHSSE